MDLPAPVASFLHENLDLLLASLVVVSVLLLLLTLFFWVRLRRLSKFYRRLFRDPSSGNLEQVLHNCLDRVESVSNRIEEVDARISEAGAANVNCLQRVSVVRYDAFEDIGGQQSFTVVLLDGARNGVALSGVYSRRDVRVYAKGIENGRASHPMTREEQQALEQALGRQPANAA